MGLTDQMIAERRAAESVLVNRKPRTVVVMVTKPTLVGRRFKSCGDEYRVVRDEPTERCVLATCGQFGRPQPFRRTLVSRLVDSGRDASTAYAGMTREPRDPDAPQTTGFARGVITTDRPRYVEDAAGELTRIKGTWPRTATVEVKAPAPVDCSKDVTVRILNGVVTVSRTDKAPMRTGRASVKGTWNPAIGAEPMIPARHKDGSVAK